jgi:chromosome segregation ATPase
MTSPDPIFRSSASRAVLAGEQDPFVTIAQLEGQIAKLQKINNALINRVERSTDYRGNSFSLFQTAILLEKKVRDRTEELQQALHNLEKTNRDLSAAKEEAETARTRLSEAIESLSEGFSLFDAQDRLVLFNSKFRSFFPDLADLIAPGIEFADFLRSAVERKALMVWIRPVKRSVSGPFLSASRVAAKRLISA